MTHSGELYPLGYADSQGTWQLPWAMAPTAVDPRLADWCRTHLGSVPLDQFFSLHRLSTVLGVTLSDGRQVALKVRTDQPRLAACRIVQQALWQAGLPCPQPLAGPHPLLGDPDSDRTPLPSDPDVDPAMLVVSAEVWTGAGTTALDPWPAQAYGQLLAQMLAAAPAVADLPTLSPDVPWLHWRHQAPDRVWPPAASDRWDPHRIEAALDPLIATVARRARRRLLRADALALPTVAGHGDFEAQNCRWVPGPAGPSLVVHDWDSVVAQPEAVLAGNSAAAFPALDDCDLSTLAFNDAFLAGYAAERGRAWSRTEWQVAHATGLWVAAYNAAFEHLKTGPGPVTQALRQQAEQRLRRADA